MLDFAYFAPIAHIEQKNKLARLLAGLEDNITATFLHQHMLGNSENVQPHHSHEGLCTSSGPSGKGTSVNS